jgi:hypothetical protein
MVDESALPPARHESSDVSARLIWIGVPALVVSVIALALVVLWLFPGRTVDRTMHLPLEHYPSPELQISPREDMSKFRVRQLQWLNSTGWVDKEHGVVHIPIDEAMRKVASDGIEGWPK